MQSVNLQEAIIEGQRIIASCQVKVIRALLKEIGISGKATFSNEKRQLIVSVAKEHGNMVHKIVGSLILPDVTTIVIEESNA